MGTAMTRLPVRAPRPAAADLMRPAVDVLRMDHKRIDHAGEDAPGAEVQRAAASSAAPPKGHSFGALAVLAPTMPKATVEVSEPDDPAEQEADQVAERVMGTLSSGAPPDAPLPLAATGPALQRAPSEEGAAEPQQASGGYLVDDEATPALSGQMRKSEFLAALRPAVCAAADRELARAGRNTEGCPYLDRWFGYYAGRDARMVERSLRKYAPETAGATSARDYIAPVSARVAQGVRRWVDTGEVPELPEGVTPGMLAGGGIGGALADVGSAIASGVSAVGSAIAGGISAIGSFFGGLFSKGREGGAVRGADHGALADRLGGGRPLDATSRSRMGAAFGYDFGAVRVHDDEAAAGAADGLNARAFTLGTHIAFGAGEYRPGTMVGDALLAHELAHVVQQAGARERAPMEAAGAHDEVEQEADASAAAAVGALWADHLGVDARPAHDRPKSRARLQLARCSGGGPAQPMSRYDELIVEGTRILKDIKFGLPFNMDRNSQQCLPGRFDRVNWKMESAPEPVHCMLVNRTDPATAVRELFGHTERWSIDCSMFSQLPHYYALVNLEGDAKFNQRMGSRIELKQLGSSGLKTKEYWAALGPEDRTMIEQEVAPSGEGASLSKDARGYLVPKDKPGARRMDPDVLLARAPIGTHVTFTHGLELYFGMHRRGFPFHNENTIKVGPDRYAAHGLRKRTGFLGLGGTTNELSKDELIERLARMAGERDTEGNIMDTHYEEAKPLIYVSAIEIYDLPGDVQTTQ